MTSGATRAGDAGGVSPETVPAFVTALQSRATASGLRAAVGAIACDAALLGALAPEAQLRRRPGPARDARRPPRSARAVPEARVRTTAPAASSEAHTRRDRLVACLATLRRRRASELRRRASVAATLSSEGRLRVRPPRRSLRAERRRRQNENETHPHTRTRGKPSRSSSRWRSARTQRHEPVRVALHDSQRVFNVGAGFQRRRRARDQHPASEPRVPPSARGPPAV